MCTSIIINGFNILAKKYPLCMKCGKILLLQNIVKCSEAGSATVLLQVFRLKSELNYYSNF